jgi:shikimate kinase
MRTERHQPLTVSRIVLTGFMGAGKSTVGALLAEKLGWRFMDTDALIEARIGSTIAQIFAEKGEPAFRALETDAVRDCTRMERLVLAVGGGAVESEPTRDALTRIDRARIVFLDAPLDLMVARCIAQPNAAKRPVLADRERLAKRLEARLPHYRMAHLTVATAGMTPDAVTESILEFLHGELPRDKSGPPAAHRGKRNHAAR